MSQPTAPISNKPPCHREDALVVLKGLRAGGHVAYFAGGCVRDELLGILPKDFDVATDAPPQRVRELFKNTQAVGAAFGVILVRHGESVIEVATFRSDGAYLDGRRPSEVKFTTAQEDAKRRDFTINGLFLDPVAGKVIDYVGGQNDLKDHLLRAIGDPAARFGEDHLRLLRAVRFAARFGLAIEPATAHAIGDQASKLKAISPERIAEELRSMFAPPTRKIAWKWLEQFGLTEIVFRFAPPMTAAPGDTVRDVFVQLDDAPVGLGLSLAAIALSRERDSMAAIAPAYVKAVTRGLRQALRFSNEEADELSLSLHGLAMVLGNAPSLAMKKRFLARSTATMSRQLLRAMAGLGVMRERIEPLEKDLEQLSQTDYAPVPFITGDDLVAAGYLPGRLFRRILDVTYDAQLELKIRTRDEAMELARNLAATSPSNE